VSKPPPAPVPIKQQIEDQYNYLNQSNVGELELDEDSDIEQKVEFRSMEAKHEEAKAHEQKP
jgi:hypothetical protein